jgi:D-alanyl-D-alanine carboxypeptidase
VHVKLVEDDPLQRNIIVAATLFRHLIQTLGAKICVPIARLRRPDDRPICLVADNRGADAAYFAFVEWGRTCGGADILKEMTKVLLVFALAWTMCPRAVFAGPTLVFNMENGHVLYADDPDVPWYPASLTKMMTAYLAFEAVRNEQAKMGTRVIISKAARRQPPTKLGLAVGKSIPLEEALRAIIIKSANDVSVAVAETISGSEQAFVKQMNRKAAELGMMNTHFVNPHGLPAIKQVTTARDMALLAQALLRDFPEHAPLYAQVEAKVGKRVLHTHNAIIVTYPGGDGIKTGYTCASGYNLVASATRNGSKVIAVILGEKSGAARTVRATALLEHGFKYLDWKALFPTPRVESLPGNGLNRGIEPSVAMVERYRDCKAPPPPPKTAKPKKKSKKRRYVKRRRKN